MHTTQHSYILTFKFDPLPALMATIHGLNLRSSANNHERCYRPGRQGPRQVTLGQP